MAKRITIILMMAAAALLTGCGGGGGKIPHVPKSVSRDCSNVRAHLRMGFATMSETMSDIACLQIMSSTSDEGFGIETSPMLYVNGSTTKQMYATLFDEQCNTLEPTGAYTWSVTPSSVGLITSGGLYMAPAVAANTTGKISVTYKGFTDTVNFTVKPGPPVTMDVIVSTVDAGSWPNNMFSTIVLDPIGTSISGLSCSNLTITENGQAATCVSASQGSVAGKKSAVALVLDVSGSMSSIDLSNQRSAANDFLALMGAQDLCAVVKFSSSYEISQDFTTDKTLCATAVNAISPLEGGGTYMYDAIYQAISMTSQQTNAQRAVVVMTDGVSSVNTYTESQVVDYALQQSTPIYTVGLGSADTVVLTEIANQSGGRFYATSTSGGLSAIYSQISNAINNQLIVHYTSPLTSCSGTVTIELEVDATVGSGSGTRTYTCP